MTSNLLDEKAEELFAFCHNKHHNNWITLWEVISIYISLGKQDKFDFSVPTVKKEFEVMLNRYVGVELVGVKLEMNEDKYRFVAGAPMCPECKIPMELHATMSGDQWLCINYSHCGGRFL